MDTLDPRTKQLIETGTELAGSAVSGALGFLAAGPIGAAGAGAIGVVISKGTSEVLADFAARHLSSRERVKIGAAASIALDVIKQKLDSGESPRSDGFFAQPHMGSSQSSQILEGILQRAKAEHEEKKINLIGNFYANLGFRPDISFSEANHLLRIIQSMTYRQMIILALVKQRTKIPSFRVPPTSSNVTSWEPTSEYLSALQEVFDTAQLGLLTRQSDQVHPPNLPHLATPVNLILSLLGQNLAALINTSAISQMDINNIATLLGV